MDLDRMIYTLAGAALEPTPGEWNANSLRVAMRRPLRPYAYRIDRLAARLSGAFVTKPTFAEVVTFLRADRSLLRGLSRAQPAPHQESAPHMSATPLALTTLRLPKIETSAELAAFLGIPINRLLWRADIASRNRKSDDPDLWNYRYRWISKRHAPANPRLLEIPKPELKRLQRRLLEEILTKIPLHPAAHAFCPGRSILTNAAPHCQKAAVLRIDLSDFFPSITAARIFRIFRTLGYPAHISRLLTGLCTIETPASVWERRPNGTLGGCFDHWQRLRTRHLPQGAPTSPALANLAATRLDRRLSALASKADAAYTRYADDLAFSGNADFARRWKRFANWVAAIALDEGFHVNHHKTRLMRPGTRQHIAGITVNAHPNIARRDFDQLKAILTNCLRTGPAPQNRDDLPDFRAHLAGRIAQLSAINPERGKKLRGLFEAIAWG